MSAVAQRNRDLSWASEEMGREKFGGSALFMDRPRSSGPTRTEAWFTLCLRAKGPVATTFLVQRRRRESGPSTNPVAGAHEGLDDLRVAQFAPQPADRHLDRLRKRVGVLVPNLFEQVLGGEEGRARFHQRFQNGQFLHGQFDQAAIAGHHPAQRVELNAGGT